MRIMLKGKSRLDEALTSQSKWCYPGTDVLINKKGIRDQEVLNTVERRISTLMLTQVQMRDLPDVNELFSVSYFQRLHKEVFGYIYEFAGKFRDENITKGNTPFCRPEYIAPYLRDLFKQMKKAICKIETRDDMLDFLSYYYTELNVIHPFREGNGRVMREYLCEVVDFTSQTLGIPYELNFADVTEEQRKQFIRGSIRGAVYGDTAFIRDFFNDTLKEKKDVTDKSIRHRV